MKNPMIAAALALLAPALLAPGCATTRGEGDGVGVVTAPPQGPPADEAAGDADGYAYAEGEVAHAPPAVAPSGEDVTSRSEPGRPSAGFGGRTPTTGGESLARVDAPSEEREPGGAGDDRGPAPQSWRRVAEGTRLATVSLGGGQTLELTRMRVTVQVEGMRARTIVDHIFHNPHGRAVEGTFRYALPPESSVAHYAMFLGRGAREPDFFGPDDALRQLGPERLLEASVTQLTEGADPALWGELRIGRIVRSVEGRQTYENVTRRRVDPALVEEIAPNTFEARVFPIQADGYNRVIVSYEQTLPRLGDAYEYSFPVAPGEIDAFDFTLVADRPLVTAGRYTGSIRGVREESTASALVFRSRLAQRSPGGDLTFRLTAPDAARGVDVLSGRNPSRREDHFVARVHADARVVGGASRYAEQAVFLLDTSLSEHPERFHVDVQLLRQILERSPGIRRFNVVTFDAGARWLEPGGFVDNTPEGRAAIVRRLESVLLEGSTDFSAALDALARPPFAGAAPELDVFVLTDGAVSWGESDVASMIQGFEARSRWNARFFAYRTGLGAENLSLLSALTRRGAVFNCLSTDSVPACATAHHASGMRIDRVEVVGRGATPAAVDELLVAGRQATLFAGAQLSIAGRVRRPGDATLRVHGSLGGAPRTLEYPITIRPRGELAPRAWAEIAVAQLLETRDPSLERLSVALSQHYRVPSRLTSFLVLETDAEYEQYDLLAERASHADGEVAAIVDAAHAQRGSARTAWDRVSRAVREHDRYNRARSVGGGAVLRALEQLADRESTALLSRAIPVPLLSRSDVPGAYVQGIRRDPEAHGHFRAEADRRQRAGQLGAAVRALSSIVENDPGSAEAARATAYRLAAWGADAQAADLMARVLEQRPYEPQSYRDLANLLWTRRPAMAAMLFEATLSGSWDGRFRQLSTVVQEEYGLFIRDVRRRQPNSPIAELLTQRERALGIVIPRSDLRVTMTWNTDNTDIDLWVTDPSGEKCYYAHRNIGSGGELLDDVTQGFGPERFRSERAASGEYVVQAHYYGNNGNRLIAETAVTVTVATHIGTPREQVSRYNVTLTDRGDVQEVARIRM